MFLIDNLWTILKMAEEERTDGDNFEGDVGVSDNLFLTWLKGGGEHFNCMDIMNREALKAQWDAEDQDAAQREYNLIMTSEGGKAAYNRYKDLCDAYHRFNEIAAEAVAALKAADEAVSAGETEGV